MSTLRVNTLQNAAGTGQPAMSGAAKAWVNFNGTGTVAIRASFNVTSITDNGTGDYTVNFTNALEDANYAPAFGSSNAASGTGRDQNIGIKNNVAPTTTALRIQVFEPNTGPVDSLYTNVAIFR